MLLLSRRRPLLDLEPRLIEDQILDVALDGHIASTRAQLPPQLLLNEKLDDVLLLLLLVEFLLLELVIVVVRGIGTCNISLVVAGQRSSQKKGRLFMTKNVCKVGTFLLKIIHKREDDV